MLSWLYLYPDMGPRRLEWILRYFNRNWIKGPDYRVDRADGGEMSPGDSGTSSVS